MNGSPELAFTLLGDIMPGGTFSERYGELRDKYLPEQIRPWFDSDVVFANLECVASTEGSPLSNKIVTYCRPESLDILTDMKVSVVSLANNHQMDYGIEASETTRRLLDVRGVRYGGVGRNIDEARHAVVLERKGRRIAFLFFTWTKEFLEPVPAATRETPGVSPLREEEVLAAVSHARDQEAADLVVVSLHWGEGKSHYVRPECVAQAHRIIEAGADMIVGHHTHCLQGFEIWHGKPIFYGLGNFLCSSYRKSAEKRLTYELEGAYRYRWLRERKTIIVRVVFSSHGLVDIQFQPLLQLDDPPILTIPPTDMEARISKRLERLSDRLARKAYAWWYFPLYRRLDECRRVLEDWREQGWRQEYLHPRTVMRVLHKFISGRSFH